ncbi:hypothetical protein HZC09_00370 [Candidatus Micrarchaeota archaeon]|nr:hypothetical protein [Candidatus Micrarchaeota archaeon]
MDSVLEPRPKWKSGLSKDERKYQKDRRLISRLIPDEKPPAIWKNRRVKPRTRPQHYGFIKELSPSNDRILSHLAQGGRVYVMDATSNVEKNPLESRGLRLFIPKTGGVVALPISEDERKSELTQLFKMGFLQHRQLPPRFRREGISGEVFLSSELGHFKVR